MGRWRTGTSRQVAKWFAPENSVRESETVSEATCPNCGHPAIMHAMMGHRCEVCAGCPGLHAAAPVARPPGYLWEIVEDRCRVRHVHRRHSAVPTRGSVQGLRAGVEALTALTEEVSHREDDMPDYVEADADIRGKDRYSLSPHSLPLRQMVSPTQCISASIRLLRIVGACAVLTFPFAFALEALRTGAVDPPTRSKLSACVRCTIMRRCFVACPWDHEHPAGRCSRRRT
jgi:hypothetical protein